MAKSRSTLLITIGIGVFIVGTGLAFVASRGGGGSSTPQVQAAAPAAPKPGDVTQPGVVAPVFSIPAGRQAVAIQLGRVQSVAGLVKAHDRVNLFGTVKGNSPPPKPNLAPTPAVKLVLSDIEVLATTPPPATAPDGLTTFVLALTPAEAEQVVYLQSFEGLYLSLARTDQGVVQTPGRSAGAPF
jgi:Flp pilus assembly protein CpaB